MANSTENQLPFFMQVAANPKIKIFEDMMELAELQKPELESTEEFPYYNVATAQVVKLRALMMQETPNKTILQLLNHFLIKQPALRSEFPKMFHQAQLNKAVEIHQRIIVHSTELETNLQAENKSAEEQQTGPSI